MLKPTNPTQGVGSKRPKSRQRFTRLPPKPPGKNSVKKFARRSGNCWVNCRHVPKHQKSKRCPEKIAAIICAKNSTWTAAPAPPPPPISFPQRTGREEPPPFF